MLPKKLYYFLANLLYAQLAWAYDGVASLVSAGMWKEWVLSVVSDLKGPSVLELGHGPGHLQLALLAQQKKIYGLDKSTQMNGRAQRYLQGKRFSPALVNGISQSLPFPSQSFQQVVATFPTPYILEQDTLTEVYRVLCPGGTLIVLLNAVIIGKKPWEKMSIWVLKLMGQKVSSDHSVWNQIRHPFQQAGFQACLEKREMRASTLFVIIAKKL